MTLRRVFSMWCQSSKDLRDLGELYHDFAMFGAVSRQKPGIFPANQRCKAPIISAYVQWAIAKSKARTNDPVSFAELFCADGYYAMLARHFGATTAIGIDNDRDNYFSQASVIANRLGLTNIEFHKLDIADIDRMPPVDIVANIGGLYHVANPREILEKSYRMAKKYLILQSVVSMANSVSDYFESPAPGWTWGSRYSQKSFDALVGSLGYRVVDKHFNELEGNDRPEDRGSVYYLIEVQASSYD